MSIVGAPVELTAVREAIRTLCAEFDAAYWRERDRLGELAIERGVDYASEREVFGRPIGRNQAIQHPLAEAHARLSAAKCLVYDAAEAAESAEKKTLGVHANAAKFLAADAAFEAADAAVQTHGGRGVAREYDVERYLREARLARLVPVTQELALSYLAETALGLPRSD